MSITSIRLIDGNRNFESIIGALHYLDLAISGMEMDGMTANKKWIGMIKHLFDTRICNKQENGKKYDAYIYSTFESFVKHKRRLAFNMLTLSYNCDTHFRNLFMDPMASIDLSQDIATIKSMVNSIDYTNLPKKEVLRIFENVRRLEIWTYLNGFDEMYIISLSSLLSVIESYPSLQIVIIGLGNKKYASKIRVLYSLSNEIKTEYENAGYDIHLEEKDREDKNIFISCVIKRKL